MAAPWHQAMRFAKIHFAGAPYDEFDVKHVQRQLLKLDAEIQGKVSGNTSVFVCGPRGAAGESAKQAERMEIETVTPSEFLAVLRLLNPSFQAFPPAKPAARRFRSTTPERNRVAVVRRQLEGPAQTLPKARPGSLANMTIFLSGASYSSIPSHAWFKTFLDKCGAKPAPKNVTQALDYLVIGNRPGQKLLQKAKGYGVPVLSENEFLERYRSGRVTKRTPVEDAEASSTDGSRSRSPSESSNSREQLTQRPVWLFSKLSGIHLS